MSRARPYGSLVVMGILAVLVSGCDVDVRGGGRQTVPEERLEQRVTDMLTQKFDKRPNDIDCPGELKAEVGQTMRCVLTSDKARLGLTVTVDSTENDQVHFQARVDEQPLPGSTQ